MTIAGQILKHLNESRVNVSHDRYERTHGKKAPRTFGGWMFTSKRLGSPDMSDPKEVLDLPSMEYKDALQKAQEWASTHGHYEIYIME